jgi:hypothetical protein
MLRFLGGLGGRRQKVSHVTVSEGLDGGGKRCHMLRFLEGWREEGKGVTCNGFWGVGGRREKGSHVLVSGGLEGGGKRCHM